MESRERLAVRRGMNQLKPYLAAYIVQNQPAALNAERSDMAALLRTLVTEWDKIYSRRLPRVVRSYVHELIDVRNRWAHESDFTAEEAARALDTMRQLGAAIGAPKLDVRTKVDLKVAGPSGKRETQRSVMRDIYARFQGNEDRIVSEYAGRERAGSVQRKANKSGLTPEEYARALLADGIAKGWLP